MARAHETIDGSRLETFDGVGHLPQLEDPARFVEVLERFLEDTRPARFDEQQWRARLVPLPEPDGIPVVRRAAG